MMKPFKTLLLAAVPLMGGAQEAASTKPFVHKVGAYEVVLLSENQGQGNASILIGATPEMMKRTMPEGNYPNAVNAFLLKMPDGHNVLFDTGFGRRLKENLAAVGVKPEEIGTLVITHAHGDHIGGMTTPDGKPAFPNARVLIAQAEKEYWVDTKQQQSVVNALEAYQGRVRLIRPKQLEAKNDSPDDFILIDAPGHTPGHVACLIRSQGEQLLIWGDLAHAMAIQMPYPQVSVTYDTDPVLAAQTRLRVLRFAAKHNIPVAGMHIAYPGMGYIKAVEGATDSFSFQSLPLCF
ncbi:MAG: MBL fold metallo-hydrolase [Mediterranea sp.]|nr:MBL fold metallo-hydrolase [Mediterranea sp.]